MKVLLQGHFTKHQGMGKVTPRTGDITRHIQGFQSWHWAARAPVTSGLGVKIVPRKCSSQQSGLLPWESPHGIPAGKINV